MEKVVSNVIRELEVNCSMNSEGKIVVILRGGEAVSQ